MDRRFLSGCSPRAIIDDAPWHRRGPIDEAPADHPRPESYRLPGESPRLNAIERSRRVLRRRATHDRLFESLADLKRSLRASLCDFQTVRGRLRRPVAGGHARTANQEA